MTPQDVILLSPPWDMIPMNQPELQRRLCSTETPTDKSNAEIHALTSSFSCRCAACQLEISRRDECGIGFEDLPYIPSPSLSRHLSDCSSVYLAAVTLGRGTDRFLRAVGLTDTALHYILDAYASAAAESLISWFDIYLRGKNARPARKSPGYGDFPLSFQKPLLSALSAEKSLGIQTDFSDYMSPAKSITAVLGNR